MSIETTEPPQPFTPPEATGPQIAAWLEGLRGFYSTAGEKLPESIVNTHPFVFVHRDAPPDEISRRCAEILEGTHLLFRRSNELGTIDEDGEWEPMTAQRLRTWLPNVGGVIPFKEKDGDNKPRKGSIPAEIAQAILASDEFRNRTPEIRAVNMVRLPVLREELDERNEARRKGFKKIELLPLGYDAPSKTYTVKSAAKFDLEIDPTEGQTWIYNLLRYFDFSDPDRLAVQVAAMLTVYARGLYSGRSPMFVWNSNLAGSGKSRLSQLVLDVVYGDAGKSGYSFGNGDEVRKELDSAAQIFAPYIWFDDVPKGTIRNTDLNRWLTAKTWRCRIMGGNRIFNGSIYAATLMTGAQLQLDAMIARRSLVVDLFPRTRARNRKLPDDAIPIDDDFFESEAMRCKVLSAMWGLVRMWDDLGRPGLGEGGHPDLVNERELESFESWSRVIPGIVTTANFGNVLAPFEAPDAGDTETRDLEHLAKTLIKNACKDRESATITMDDIVSTARLEGLFIEHLGALDDVVKELEQKRDFQWNLSSAGYDLEGEEKEACEMEEKRKIAAPYQSKSIQSSWGKRIRKSGIFGQWFEVDGVVWEFSDRRSSRKATFPITQVKK